MPRYLITTRRAVRGSAPTARDVVGAEPDVTMVAGDDPDVVTIETSPQKAEALRCRLVDTHIVEPEIRRQLH